MAMGATLLYAAIEGICNVLPISASGHLVALRVWLDSGGSAAVVSALAQLGCLLGLLVMLRERLGRAIAEGVRGIARPAGLQESSGGRDAVAVSLGGLVAAVTHALAKSLASSLNEVPLVAGAGLFLTSAALVSTLLAPPPDRMSPGAVGAAVTGVAFGAAVVPGMSPVAAAFVVLRWLGVDGWRAAEMALLVSLPAFALGSVRALITVPDMASIGLGAAVASALVAFVGASLAVSWWRTLSEKSRTAWLALWLVPLSLALIAYSHALPEPATPPQTIALQRP